MFWHLLLSEQREQLGRQLLCCLGRQLIAVFAKARDRRQCRGNSRRQHKRPDYRGADHCYTPTRNLSYLDACSRWLSLGTHPDQGSPNDARIREQTECSGTMPAEVEIGLRT